MTDHEDALDELRTYARNSITDKTINALVKRIKAGFRTLPVGTCEKCFGFGSITFAKNSTVPCPECQALTRPPLDLAGLRRIVMGMKYEQQYLIASDYEESEVEKNKAHNAALIKVIAKIDEYLVGNDHLAAQFPHLFKE